MISSAQLKAAVTAAKGQFGLLRKKYPIISGYLVLSLPSGQTGLDSSPAQILKEFPAVVVDDAAKTSALNLQSSLTDENTSSEVERRSKEQKSRLLKRKTYYPQKLCSVIKNLAPMKSRR